MIIQCENGGWKSFDYYCDSQDKGSGLIFVNINDDELNNLELGLRVTNYIAEFECTGWDALMDLTLESFIV